jgi:hypothetical protein
VVFDDKGCGDVNSPHLSRVDGRWLLKSIEQTFVGHGDEES